MNNVQLHNSSQRINIVNQTMNPHHWKTARGAAQKMIWAKEDEAASAWRAFITCYGGIDNYFSKNPTYTWAGHYCSDSNTAKETLRHFYLIYATDTMDGVELILANTKNMQILYDFEWLCLPYLFFQAEGKKDVHNRPPLERSSNSRGVSDDTKNDWTQATWAADKLTQVEWTQAPDERRGQPGDLPEEWFDTSSHYAWLTSGRRTKAQRFKKTSHIVSRDDLILPSGLTSPWAKDPIPAAPVAVVAKVPSHHTYKEPLNTRQTKSSIGTGGGGGMTQHTHMKTHGKINVYQNPGPNPRPAKGTKTKPPKKDRKKDNIRGVSKGAIRRMAYRAGIRRISGIMYEETRGLLKNFVERIVKDSVTYCEHTKRTTVTVLDVLYALRKRNKHLYGYGY